MERREEERRERERERERSLWCSLYTHNHHERLVILTNEAEKEGIRDSAIKSQNIVAKSTKKVME